MRELLSDELLENDLNVQTVGNFTTFSTDNEIKAISHSQNLKWHLAQILTMSVPGTFETWSCQSISACLYWKCSHADLCVKIKIFLSPKEDIFIPTCLDYLSHLQRLLLLHTSLETKTPWRSAGQCNHHFLRHHCLAFFPFLVFLLTFCSSFYVSIAGGPQCFSPMLSKSGPPPESSDLLFACYALRVLSWSPASRPTLTPEHTSTRTHVHPPTPRVGQPS